MNPHQFPLNLIFRSEPILGENQIRIDKPEKGGLVDFAKGIGSITAMISTLPHILPTAVRSYNDDTLTEISYYGGNSDSKMAGGHLGLYFGMISYLAQIGLYQHLISEGKPEYLLIPAATNLASLVFESAKKFKEYKES